MIALILSFIGPKLIGVLAAVVAALAWGFNQRVVGARKERAKQAASEAKARDVADAVDNDVGALTPAQRRERLGKWSKS